MAVFFVSKKQGLLKALKKLFDVLGIKRITSGLIGYDVQGNFVIRGCTIQDRENTLQVDSWTLDSEPKGGSEQ